MFTIGMHRNDAGFTILELVIVFVVFALMAKSIMIWMPQFSDRAAVAHAASLLERELNRAAVVAARTGHDQSIQLRETNTSWGLLSAGRLIGFDPAVKARWTAAKEIGTSTEQATIVFWAVGGASGGILELSRGRAAESIDIDWLTAKTRRRR